MSTPNSQAASREKNEAAENGHGTKAEDLKSGRRNDADRLGVTEHLKHVSKYP